MKRGAAPLALVALVYRALSLSPATIGPVKAMILGLDVAAAEKILHPLLAANAVAPSIRERLGAFATSNGVQI